MSLAARSESVARRPNIVFQPVNHTVVVSPAMAMQMFEGAGIDPDKVGSTKYVQSLESYIRSGQWKLNGEAIIIGADGSILDGKRRLAACVRSNCGFPAILIFGVDPDAFTTINAHKKRTTRDVMHIERVESPSEKIAAATMTRAMALGVEHYDSGNLSIGPGFVKELFDRYPTLNESILVARQARRQIAVGQALLAAAHFMFAAVDADRAAQFFDGIIDPSCEHKAIAALRKEIARSSQSRRVPRRLQAAALIKSWNAFWNGTSRPNVRMAADERMPVISGNPIIEMPINEVDPAEMPAPEREEAYRKAVEAALEAGLSVEVLTFSPDEAKEILETRNGPSFSGINRAISASKVRVLTRDMRAGSWKMNGQAIKFGKSGRLIDGQHRLASCVESGMPITSVVIEGIEDDAFRTIDQGSQRNLRQAIKNLGIPSYSFVNDVAVVLWRWENGYLGKTEAPSITEGLDVVSRWLDRIREASLMYSFKTNTRDIMTEAQSCWLHLILREKDADDADRFMKDLIYPDMIAHSDPIRTLREIFVSSERGRSSDRARTGPKSVGRLRERNIALLVFETWNLRRQGLGLHRKGFSLDETRPIPELI